MTFFYQNVKSYIFFLDWPSIYDMKIGEVVKFLQTTDLDTNEISGIVRELRTAYQQWVKDTLLFELQNIPPYFKTNKQRLILIQVKCVITG